MMSLTNEVQSPKGAMNAEGVAVAAPCMKENNGQSAHKINRSEVTNSAGFQGVTPTTKSYPRLLANRSAQSAPGGRVSYGPSSDRGPPPGLRGSPGDEYNA